MKCSVGGLLWKTSVAYEMHFGLNGHNWRSSGGNTSGCVLCVTFVIRQITSHQLTTFSLGQVLSTWLCGLCANVCKCLCMLWGSVVVCRRGVVCWQQQLGWPAGIGQCMPVVCLFVCKCMCAQQFDQSDKGLGCGLHSGPNTLCRPHPLLMAHSPPLFPRTHTQSPLP